MLNTELKKVFARNSVRSYLSREISKEVLSEVLETAVLSPSWANTQPCQVHVVTGDLKEKISNRMIEAGNQGLSKNPDIPIPKEWPEAMTERMKVHAKERSRHAQIPRDNKQKRFEFQLQMYRFFDAPYGLIFTLEQSLEEWSLLDVGFAMQNIMLAAELKGLGTCPQASAVYYPNIIREELGLDESTKIIAGMAIGYPDYDAPVNQYKASRRAVEEVLIWY